MKKFLGFLVALVLIGLVGFMWWTSTYNTLNGLKQDVGESWGQVQNVYQRRADLIPNLVATVKGYATHEEKVFQEVAEARAKIGSVNIDASKLAADPEAQKLLVGAQQQLSGALSHLIAVAENYPTLKADQGFLTLQSQIEGAENRISTERHRNQEVVGNYNRAVRSFFTSIVANHYGFKELPYFTADDTAQKAPVVKF